MKKEKKQEFILRITQANKTQLVVVLYDMTLAYLEDSMEEWKDLIYGSRHTLYPVCDGTADQIVGILNAKTYFRLENKDRESVMEKAVIPAYFVPDTVKADTLFRNMRKERHGMAVILDEYGGTRGIITINDLVEQLVGDLGNSDIVEEEGSLELLEENLWKVQGSVSLDEISEILRIPIDTEEYDTLSGLVFHEYGSVPKDGSCIEITYGRMNIKVTEIKEHQIENALIRITPEEKKQEEEE